MKKFILCLSSFVKVCKEQEKKEEHRDGGWQSVFIDRCGWLGNNIVKQLIEKGCRVRGLVLKGDKAVRHIPKGVEIVYGDLTDKTSLENFFDVEKEQLVCIHCASIVYLKEEPSELVYRVNVEGTRNVIDLCLKKNVEKLVYVSSTGTVAELPPGQLMREPEKFDLDKIVGYYGKT